MTNTMSQQQRDRVAIAQDALAWEEAGMLVADIQHYLCSVKESGEKGNLFRISQGNLDKQARDLILGKCCVCALGGLLLAKAVRFDRVTGQDIFDINITPLLDHFSPTQISEIEAAYEGSSYPTVTKTYGPELTNHAWREKYPVPSDRFRAIMRNIIRNDGYFDSDDLG